MKNVVYSALVIVLMGGCGRDNKNNIATDKVEIAVVATKVQPAKNGNDLRYSGTIEPFMTIPLTFQTMGNVEQIFVEAGDAVKKGQLLATVDKSDLKNIYDASLAKYQQAKDAYDRLKTVHEQGSLPEIKWVEMVTNLEQAKSAFDISKNNLEKCNMRAPEDGVIGQRNVEPGQAAFGNSMSPLVLVKIETVFVKISVPENEINTIKKGLNAKFKVSALNEKQFEGIVTNVSPVADVISRTYSVKIMVKNQGMELKPGMVCDVMLNLGSESVGLLVPYNAVSTDRDGKPFVYVVSADNKSVKKQNIKTGHYNGSGIEVIGGLNAGTTIVVEGKEKLADNSLISL